MVYDFDIIFGDYSVVTEGHRRDDAAAVEHFQII